jgi:serine/threonine-protein kinase
LPDKSKRSSRFDLGEPDMSPLSENPTSTEFERLLQEAREGSGVGMSKALTLCRDYLVALALEELPAGPRRETLAVDLAASALQEVRERLAAFDGHSESDLRSWLRQILIVRTQALPKPPPVEDLANLSTPDPGIGVTAESQRVPDAGVLPATEPMPATLSFQAQSFFDQATKPALKTDPDQGYNFSPNIDLSIPTALAKLEGFQIVSELGRGGMGIVYRAWQERLERWVALKCLPAAFSEDPERLGRFRQEARLTAQLTEHGIIQVHDIVEAGNTPILVLPYIDGCDLARVIKQRQALQEGKAVDHPHPWASLSEKDYLTVILPFFDKVLDSLVRLHGAGVLHRDLKPSNILLDKNANGWLTDFGLARMGHLDTSAQPGHGMGTPGFMGPEQWEGDENIDARTDVFSIGVTIYQALTLKLPYGKTKIKDSTPPAQLPKTSTRSWPSHLDLVLQKAIEPNRGMRYPSVAELRDDWLRVRKGRLPEQIPISTPRWLFHAASSKASLIVAALAVSLATVLAIILWTPTPRPLRTVHVATEPAGAKLALVPLSAADGTPQYDKAFQPSGSTPVTVSKVPPGDYLVIVEVENHGFHEVYRRVPEPEEAPPNLFPMKNYEHLKFTERPDKSIELPLITVPEYEEHRRMALFPGGTFTMGTLDFGAGLPPAPVYERSVESFYLDQQEVTVGEFRNKIKEGIPKELETTSLNEDDAIRLVNFDQAVHFAELIGKRLPDETEYEYAATNAGTQRFPWGNGDSALPFMGASTVGLLASAIERGPVQSSSALIVQRSKYFPRFPAWPIGRVKAASASHDKTRTDPPVYGLFSNVAEWTSSWYSAPPGVDLSQAEKTVFKPDLRIVRGGPYCVLTGDPQPQGKNRNDVWDARFRYGISRDQAHLGLGFRCARSVQPHFPK